MKDFQDENELEQTLYSVWKTIAWHLTEVSKKHDTEICDNKTKIEGIHIDQRLLQERFANHLENHKQGWTTLEKIVAVLGYLIMAALTVLSLMK